MNEIARPPQLRTVISAEQIQKRVREMGARFPMTTRPVHPPAGLARERLHLHGRPGAGAGSSRVCQFIKPKYQLHEADGSGGVLEIFFSHEPDIRGQNLLVVEGLVHSGVTTEFLMSDLKAGARLP